MANVYIVQGENCFSENGEVCWIEGVFSSRKKAEVAKRLAEDAALDEGKSVLYRSPESESEWDVCFEVIEHPVQ